MNASWVGVDSQAPPKINPSLKCPLAQNTHSIALHDVVLIRL